MVVRFRVLESIERYHVLGPFGYVAYVEPRQDTAQQHRSIHDNPFAHLTFAMIAPTGQAVFESRLEFQGVGTQQHEFDSRRPGVIAIVRMRPAGPKGIGNADLVYGLRGGMIRLTSGLGLGLGLDFSHPARIRHDVKEAKARIRLLELRPYAGPWHAIQSAICLNQSSGQKVRAHARVMVWYSDTQHYTPRRTLSDHR